MKQLLREDFEDRLLPRVYETRTPETMALELTYGCNLRCVHCLNPTHKALSHELTTGEVFDLLDQFVDLGVLTVTLTGGELFTRADLFEVCEYATQRGLLLEVISNATRITAEMARRLRAIPFKDICFSIYGASSSTYEQVTQQPHSYAQFLAGLEQAAAVDLPVSAVRMPVMTLNQHEVLEAKRLVEHMGFKFQISMEIFPRTDSRLDPLRYRLTPEDKVALGRMMWGDGIGESTEPSCTPSDRFIGCACGKTRFAVTPYGEMNLCTAFPIPRYDLRKGTVREGWDLLKATVDRATAIRQDDCPTCLVRPTCQQKRNHAWLETGDMSACLPHYKTWASLEQQFYVSIDSRRAG